MAKCLLTTAAICALALPALASAPHDGSWAIQIVTQRGSCNQVSNYYVDIDGQTVRLHKPFGGYQTVRGLIRPSGRIKTTIGQAGNPVTVTGRLSGRAGAGVWSAPAQQCSGRWSASKR